VDILIICAAAAATSCLTFFSGFGLGTLLMPVFLLFFPLETAIALTAVVHFLNNVLKFFLMAKEIHWRVALSFGLPAFLAAFAGARALFKLEEFDPVFVYTLMGKEFQVLPVKLVIAAVMVLFLVLETLPLFKKVSFSPKVLPAGGVVSGFFGGLSGHQGALRTMFLLKCGLSKEAFIATGVVIAFFVDVSRLSVYWGRLAGSNYQDYAAVMAAAVASAFAGILIGKRLLKKMTLAVVERVIAVMLFVIAVLLGAGVI